MMRLVVPFGFYGAGNIGDEATLHGFARLLAHSGLRTRVSVGSLNPQHTARVEPSFRYFHPRGYDPRRWVAKYRAAAHVMAGGTPIMDVQGDWPLSEVGPIVRSTDRWKAPLAFIGVGTEPLQHEESRRIVAEDIAPRVRHWSVRSDRDRQRLIEYGVAPGAITVAADMAWLIEPATPDFGRRRLQKLGIDPGSPVIGVNLVNENEVFDRHPDMVDALAVALDELAGRMDARVVFLANEVRTDSTFDKAAALQVMKRMQRVDRIVLSPPDYLSPAEMMSIIACCSLTLSMRYHFCLFSALQRVPFIAIERSGKVSDLCWDLDWPARVASPRLIWQDILAHGMHLRQTTFAIHVKLRQSIQEMKTRALRNLSALYAVIKMGSAPQRWQSVASREQS